jgi:hypothetical protein
MSTKVSNINRKAATALFAAILATSATFAGVQATTHSNIATAKYLNNEDEKDAQKVKVKYLGSLEDGVMFNVAYNNAASTDFSLTILDENGETVYTDVFNDKQFNKKFKVAKDYSKLTFVIRSNKEKFEQSFDINISSRLVDDVVVSRN